MTDREKLRSLRLKIEKTMNKLDKLQDVHMKLTGDRHIMPLYLDKPLWARRAK